MSTFASAAESDLPPELCAVWRTHVSADTAPLERLVELHRDVRRHYHGVAHVRSVVDAAVDLTGAGSHRGNAVGDPGAVIAAAFFHDAIYDAAAADNEVRSAELTRRELRGLDWPAERVERVATMIEGTVDHRDPPDADHATLFDADLAILGAEASVYDRYVAAVRAEYAAWPNDAWRSGRSAVLSSLLERPSIFATATGIERWESTARSNLERELTSLRE